MSNRNNKFGVIGVLMGGVSSEREISLKSGKAVYEALRDHGQDVEALDIAFQDSEKIEDFIRSAQIDTAFIALHGKLGEDGTIQSILDGMNIPYPGSGVEASRLSLNKALAQKILRQNNIPVPDFEVLIANGLPTKEHFKNSLNVLKTFFPLVVKPSCEGSSIGISIINKKQDLAAALREAFRYGEEVLVERFIKGRELTVGILDQSPLPVIEIRPRNHFFDFNAKYQQGLTDYLIPAPLPEDVMGQVQEVALAAHTVLGCRDFSRVDLILDDAQRPYVLEINTIPGFTATSLLPKAAKEAGLDFTQLCLKLLELADEKKRKGL